MALKLFDSTFFVDLDREKRSGKAVGARAFLARHPRDEMAMSCITRGELARGFATRGDWLHFCRGFLVLPLDAETLWMAAGIFRHLRESGRLIADNDLWIAATALRHGIELVTENRRHFERVPALRVLSHREG